MPKLAPSLLIEWCLPKMIVTQRPILTLAVACCIGVSLAQATVVERRAQETLTAVQLDEQDTLRFTLANGQTRTLTVESTDARVLLTNLPRQKQGFHGGETMYEMSCRIRIDGHRMTMRRYVPVQQSFYEPYVVNGMRIWFDGVRKVDRFLNDNHGGGVPRKDVRLAIQDMTSPICPQSLRPWYPNADDYIDVGQCYNANDVWMGPYFGADLHGGLDINMPIGTPLWAPIDFDDQYYFNSLESGHNNNRWRGVRTWPDGQRWVLQAHHIVRLRVPQHSPLRQGVDYAEAAGVLTGSHAHSHFVFKVGPENDETLLDACKRWKSGHRGSYLMSRGKASGDGRVRFTPNLDAGVYRVSLSADTPFRPSSQFSQDIRFRVRVRHRDGIKDVWIEPLKSREIGVFPFDEGTGGYVEILASGATGPAVADAVEFQIQPN